MEKNKHSLCEMSNLPHEIVVDILSRLPVKSVLRFRCVCKAWCTLITNPHFVNLHLNQANENNDNHLNLILSSGPSLFSIQPFSIDSIDVCSDPVKLDLPFESSNSFMKVVGSCNGLLCVSINWNTIFLWNPSTREYEKLIDSPIRGTFYRQPILGFGYSPTTEQYKVVRILCSFPNDDPTLNSFQSRVEVYTLDMDSWKEGGDVPYYICGQSSGKYVNGAFHWIASSRGLLDLSLEVIISFDMGDEEFREVPQPDFGKRNPDKSLGVLEGCLCIVCNFSDNHVEIWVMKDYGVRESWNKQFFIRQLLLVVYLRYLKLLGSSKNGQFLLLEGNNKELVLYNSKNETIRDLRLRGVCQNSKNKKRRDLIICGLSNWFANVTYVGSLVSLKG